jgi:hypothetical protein
LFLPNSNSEVRANIAPAITATSSIQAAHINEGPRQSVVSDIADEARPVPSGLVENPPEVAAHPGDILTIDAMTTAYDPYHAGSVGAFAKLPRIRPTANGGWTNQAGVGCDAARYPPGTWIKLPGWNGWAQCDDTGEALWCNPRSQFDIRFFLEPEDNEDIEKPLARATAFAKKDHTKVLVWLAPYNAQAHKNQKKASTCET